MSILKESEMAAGVPFCLSHIGIPTVDADATIEFYERLGFNVIGRFANPRTNSLAVFLRLGNAVLEIYEGKERNVSSGAINHIALQVDDIEAAFKFAVKNGLSPASNDLETLPFWENGVRFFTVIGVNGEIVEFIQRL